MKPKKSEHKCPPHHFIFNSENVGKCKYCSEVKDCGRLLRREGVFAAAGRRGAKASKGVARKPYGGRGRKKKEVLL